jgi:integration host factor subunit alpha
LWRAASITDAAITESPDSITEQRFEGDNMALTKAEMAERLFEEVGLNKREAKEFVDAYFNALRESLERGKQVKLSGFGNFELRKKNQRPGRNPKTGEEIPISARTVVTFRPGQKLKERVEAYAGSEHARSGQ